MASRFRGRPTTVEAAQWFPETPVAGVIACKECIAMNQAIHGWLPDGRPIDSGDWIVTVGELSYVVPWLVFETFFEPIRDPGQN